MNDTRLAELREKYKNRNLLEELAWGIYADHSGYTTKQSGEFLNWLCNMAYRAVKGQQKAWIPVSKRLPEGNEKVLVCGVEAINNSRVYAVKNWDVDTWRPLSAPSVKWLAWMPLPEPYEEG